MIQGKEGRCARPVSKPNEGKEKKGNVMDHP